VSGCATAPAISARLCTSAPQYTTVSECTVHVSASMLAMLSTRLLMRLALPSSKSDLRGFRTGPCRNHHESAVHMLMLMLMPMPMPMPVPVSARCSLSANQDPAIIRGKSSGRTHRNSKSHPCPRIIQFDRRVHRTSRLCRDTTVPRCHTCRSDFTSHCRRWRIGLQHLVTHPSEMGQLIEG
jgi:hypothetical protein